MRLPSALPVVLVLLVPLVGASGLDVHAGAFDSTRRCEGDRTLVEDAYEDGSGGSWSYRDEAWDEQCSEWEDAVGASVERDGATLARAGAGDRFEGRSAGYDVSSRSRSSDGATSSWSYHDEYRDGTFSRGVHAEVLGESASIDAARCDGVRQTSSWSEESAFRSMEHRGSGRDAECQVGLFARGAGESAEARVLDCTEWGYEGEGREGPAPEGYRNQTLEYRSCRAEHRIDAPTGGAIHVLVWSGRAADCWGAWNGTAHETTCSDWWTGEWTSARVEVRGVAGWWDSREAYVPYEVDVLP